MRRRSKTLEEHLSSLRYNIRDATEALRAAVSMERWDNVIKYAKQLRVLERKLFTAEAARPRKARIAEAMGEENMRRRNTESEAERRRRLSSRGWSFGTLPSRDPSKSDRPWKFWIEYTHHGYSAVLVDRYGRSINKINGSGHDTESTVRTSAKRHWPGVREVKPPKQRSQK